jgi:hypothetical protein
VQLVRGRIVGGCGLPAQPVEQVSPPLRQVGDARGRDAGPQAEPAVANMSVVGGVCPTLDAAVTTSVNSGANHAVATGNDDVNSCSQSPARIPVAITVGATGGNDARASFN